MEIINGIKMRSSQFSMEQGMAAIQYPATMSKEEVQDFVEWLAIIVRQLRRSAEKAEAMCPTPNN